jgi:hypothetical protein
MYPDPIGDPALRKKIFLAVFRKSATDLLPDAMGNVFYCLV